MLIPHIRVWTLSESQHVAHTARPDRPTGKITTSSNSLITAIVADYIQPHRSLSINQCHKETVKTTSVKGNSINQQLNTKTTAITEPLWLKCKQIFILPSTQTSLVLMILQRNVQYMSVIFSKKFDCETNKF